MKISKGREYKATWSPNYLGLKYRYARAPLGGTHASPGMHYRRGTMRYLRVGEGKPWKTDQDVWVEGTWVMREKEKEHVGQEK